jgi:valyl-tRNA synthetase
MGTALNWTYIDIAARYKRMRGFNVLFPQGTP